MTTTPPWMSALNKHGSGGLPVNDVDRSHMVPVYDIHGCAHHRTPYKDKSYLNDVEIRHHRWLQPPPAIKSRAELQQARKRGRIPDPTYDFDGDGVVSQLDYFVGRSFDKDCDGRLTPGERRQAERALEGGFLNQYMRGLDSQGDKFRPFALQQKRGVILSADNALDVSKLSYPKHHNAHHVPKHNTKTSLEMSRLGERKGAGAAIGERYMAANEPIPEPVPLNHVTHPRTCEVSHIRERAEADHQLARLRGGLLPMNSCVNPERECRAIGLDYDHAPPMATRSQLLETRKEGMRRECEEQRTKCDNIQVPLSVRRTRKEADEIEFRRGGEDAMTLTKLKDRRRRDKIEYDMDRFVHRQKEYPKFSDRPDIPFWASGEKNPDQAPVIAAMPRTLSEPVFKIHEVPFGDDVKESHQTLPDAAYATAAGLPATVGLTKTSKEVNKTTVGSKTKKRFCAEMIERGHARNMPRMFDAIQPLHTGPLDMLDIDVTSSLAPVREMALKKNAEQRKVNAENPKRSIMWSESSDMQQVSNSGSPAAIGHSDGGMRARNETMTSFGSRSRGDTITSMDGMNSDGGRRYTQERSASVTAGPTVRASRVHHVTSDPSLHGSRPQANFQAPREPKTFHSLSKAASDSGVRCGGFHRLDFLGQGTSRPLVKDGQQHHRSSAKAAPG